MLTWLLRLNPTKKFTRVVTPPLIWDTMTGQLNGITLGGTIDTLAPLGAASHHASLRWGHYNLEYGELGLSIIISDGETHSALFPFSHLDDFTKDPKFRPASLVIEPYGLKVSKETREQDVLALFGEPSERDVDDEMISILFDVGTLTYEFDFDTNGPLISFCVYA